MCRVRATTAGVVLCLARGEQARTGNAGVVRSVLHKGEGQMKRLKGFLVACVAGFAFALALWATVVVGLYRLGL
jgi:hypothetical protein